MRDPSFGEGAEGDVVVFEVKGGHGEAGEEGSSISVGKGWIFFLKMEGKRFQSTVGDPKKSIPKVNKKQRLIETHRPLPTRNVRSLVCHEGHANSALS